MAWEEYNPKVLRIIMNARGLNAGDIAKRTGGKVARTTVRNVMIGERPTAQEKTLEAIARALYVSRDELRGDDYRTGALPHRVPMYAKGSVIM
jgi:transcriptional regulator with XRE-family HTH domain